MIEASDVRVRLGRREVLRGVGFSAAAGKITAIVGPNGSGKTTLLRAMTGDLPYRGSITLNGHEVGSAGARVLARMRAVLQQAATLSFPFTVREVVRLGLTSGVEGVSGEADDLPGKALARVDLAGHAGRMYQELSGGEQQRVQLARVLCQVWSPVAHGRARWLFLDEPVSSLDIRHQLDIMTLARDYARAGGGVVAVMHDLNLTAMFADRIAVMHDGLMLASGEPGAVLTDDILSSAYGCDLRVGVAPPAGTPFVLPHAAAGLQ